MRGIRPGPRAVAIWIVAPALILASCTPPPSAAPSQAGTQDSGPLRCTNIQVSALGSEDAPDFAGYGFPRVAATQAFVPGVESTINATNITLTLPANMYTEPLIFELLVSDPESWQACMPAGQLVIAPYAYRARESVTSKPVGRFDNPVSAAITHPRISASAKYWITTSTDPPTADVSSSGISVEGSTLRVPNGTARRGWFVTVPG